MKNLDDQLRIAVVCGGDSAEAEALLPRTWGRSTSRQQKFS